MVEKERKRGLPFVGSVVDNFRAAYYLSQCNDQDLTGSIERCNALLSGTPDNEQAFAKRQELMADLKAQRPVLAYDLNTAALAIGDLPAEFRVALLYESAKLAQKLNRGNEATKHYKRLFEVDPGNEGAVGDYQEHIINALRTDAKECVQKGKSHSAVSVLARLLEQRPGDETARKDYCGLVEELEKKGDPFSMGKATWARETFLKLTGASLGEPAPQTAGSSAVLYTSNVEL